MSSAKSPAEKEDRNVGIDISVRNADDATGSSADASRAAKPEDDWRARAEEKRKAALKIQARKRKKLKAEADAKASESPHKMPLNPYAKAAKTAKSTPAGSPVPVSRAPQPPPVTSAWGDCRLDLWEAACTCGGERKAPDVRMCSCLAPDTAGLVCQGCQGGVLLIKHGPRGPFWGCSMYKKRGCKYTQKFGPPHDAKAAARLAQMRQAKARKAERDREEMARIADPYEVDWRSVCRCGGAKNRNTFECFMRSEGGCGMLPLCPNGCGGELFLRESNYGSGRWWGCSNYKTSMCNFHADYIEHR